MPLAVAAYNAGPGAGAANGWPPTATRAAAGGDMIDWIELIPFGETRNYVQRVIENMVVYRALRGGAAGAGADVKEGQGSALDPARGREAP